MKEIILIKNGELALKGLNRRSFEDVLIKNIKNAIRFCGEANIIRAQSTITIEPKNNDFNIDEAEKAISKVFGIAAFSRAAECEKNIETIKDFTSKYLKDKLLNAKTFKVEAKRADKSFPLTSPEISREVGGDILRHFNNLKVDVKNPEITVTVEVRDKFAFIRANQLPGAGGMPVGTAGKAAVLISGGIDSPVAAYMMAKRGLKLDAIHFASPPYTSIRAEIKVKTLLSEVAAFSGDIKLFIVPFTEIQTAIAENCKEEYFTLIMRRMMMRIAQKIAEQNSCKALISGESLGQVASQTLGALCSTNAVCNMPVFRPLIGMDKIEITEISRKIGTFETSIEPYEDCCTVFTPKHPRTNPKINDILAEEAKFDYSPMVERAVQNVTAELINQTDY